VRPDLIRCLKCPVGLHDERVWVLALASNPFVSRLRYEVAIPEFGSLSTKTALADHHHDSSIIDGIGKGGKLDVEGEATGDEHQR